MKKFILSVIAGCLLFTNVWADHEADHRYNIRGYVLDTKQNGIKGLTIQAFADGALLGTGKTDPGGYYSLHLHLHDEDYHRTLKLQAGPHEAELKVSFEPGDKTSSRVHEANFVAGKFVEGKLGRFRIPPWSYAVGGLLLIMLIAVLLEKRRKKKVRLEKYGPGDKQSTSGHKAKKARRKKN